MDFWYWFWSILWYSLLGFAFIASLFAIFAVLADLVRDRTLNGWYKAIWMFFLVFVPFLTVFVYFIARGRGMADRQAGAADKQKQATEGYIRHVAGSSPADEIAKARTLLENGAITQAEFEAIKSTALGTSRQAPSTHAAV
ncbi:phospholipase D-like protein [Curtobacterium sp. PhB130]|nr:SHOCT domain-containing protein [Curtobacterium sp. PhB136]ROS75176.1 phospholipase D-like protein [Curtobacterium sp. PhB130]TCK63801.1 phospholipase D-like protein [Curtobacterium sp. PhB136]